MSPHGYSEGQLVEQPAIGRFAALGWQTVSALEATFGAGGTGPCHLGRETRGEVVLVERLRAALGQLNPGLPPEAIQTAIDELTRGRSARVGVGRTSSRLQAAPTARLLWGRSAGRDLGLKQRG